MEALGILAAVLSSALGGTAVGATRYLAGALDPLTIGAVRFGGGFLILFALALWQRSRWPARRDWLGAAALGLLFFGLFPVLFNAALIYTTAARGALALSTVPLLTMAAATVLRIEPPTIYKIVGVLIAMGGVLIALGASLATAPPGAWRGDLLMVAAACCMALYNVWSRPFVSRSGPVPFAAFGMGVGAVCLSILAVLSGGFAQLASLSTPQWIASAYLTLPPLGGRSRDFAQPIRRFDAKGKGPGVPNQGISKPTIREIAGPMTPDHSLFRRAYAGAADCATQRRQPSGGVALAAAL
jgi:drug/metabolite transporter (DMT)-like permease